MKRCHCGVCPDMSQGGFFSPQAESRACSLRDDTVFLSWRANAIGLGNVAEKQPSRQRSPGNFLPRNMMMILLRPTVLVIQIKNPGRPARRLKEETYNTL